MSMYPNDARIISILGKILPYIENSKTIIDIGSGNCKIAHELQEKSFSVTAVDIVNKSTVTHIVPVLFDGKHLPFEDNFFDVSLLITVLHHTPYPIEILKEAKRVSKYVVVIEDLYEGTFQKYMTFIMDSVLNFEFFNHPHTNKTLKEWQKIFKELDLEIIDQSSHNFWKFFTSGTFYLKKKD